MRKNTDWQVESLRITSFPEDGSRIVPSVLWDRYIEIEPAEVHIQRDRVDARHVEYANGLIYLAKQQDRVEWRYVASQDDAENPRFPIIGDLNTELAEFVRLSNQWLTSTDFGPVVRLAFGAVLLRPTDNLQNGYADLSNYLPFLNAENLTDFGYRANRRRDSDMVSGISINRLSQWSVATFRSLDIALEQAEVHMASTRESYATRLELDVNTLQDRSAPLPSEHIATLFEELVDLGLEISAKGDIL